MLYFIFSDKREHVKKRQLQWHLKKAAPKKKVRFANIVTSVFVEQEIEGDTKESTLEKRFINVNCVPSTLAKQGI